MLRISSASVVYVVLRRGFISIHGQPYYLWRAVDQDGDVLDILIQRRRNQEAAERFFRKVLKGQGEQPREVVTDKLASYGPAQRAILPNAEHNTGLNENNRAEVSHQPTRQRERQMRRFKSAHQAQRFLGLHARINNLFRYQRHLVSAAVHRIFRGKAFAVWNSAALA